MPCPTNQRARKAWENDSTTSSSKMSRRVLTPRRVSENYLNLMVEYRLYWKESLIRALSTSSALTAPTRKTESMGQDVLRKLALRCTINSSQTAKNRFTWVPRWISESASNKFRELQLSISCLRNDATFTWEISPKTSLRSNWDKSSALSVRLNRWDS